MQETPKSLIWLRFTAEPRTVSRDTYRGERNNADTWHLYLYCANNPVNYVDPSGHYVISVGVKSEAAVILGAYVTYSMNFDKRNCSITKTSGGVIMTNASMSLSLSVSYYAKKTNVSQLKGLGISTGISATWGLYLSAGAGAEISTDGDIGGSGSIGGGCGIAPAHWAVNIGYTSQLAKWSLFSFTKQEKNYTLGKVKVSTQKNGNVKIIKLKSKRIKASVYKSGKVKVTRY